jgi:hypothetical protein
MIDISVREVAWWLAMSILLSGAYFGFTYTTREGP